MSIESEFDQLIAPTRQVDPRLHQALLLMAKKVGALDEQLNPTQPRPAGTTPVTTGAILPPTIFTVVSTGSTLRFNWSAVSNAFQYEIREGTFWVGDPLIGRTTDLRLDSDPVLYGTHNYMIASIGMSGAYSTNVTQASITIPQIPAVVINSTVIDNNILLYWNVPTSTFNIRHYILKRNGVEIGLVTGTFTAIFEPLAGIYAYSVTAVDIAGNAGTEATLSVEVNQPPDFELQDSRISLMGGTKVNTYLENDKLICCHAAQTWAAHFSTRGWTTIAQQVAAGYPLYIQPTNTTGSYEEVIDYGVVIQSIIVTILYNLTQLAGSTTVVIKMAASADNITYTAFVAGSAQFYASFRYLKIRLEFTGVDDHAVAQVWNINTILTVKRENDGGEISALSTDATGTVVLFNKPFKDVESITLTVKENTAAFVAIYDFIDVPNPVSFKVYVFTLAGVRASKTVSWKARGII